MTPEECGVCGDAVPFADTVHVMIHTHSDEGVLDYYVCQSCYAEDLRPLFPDPATAEDEAAAVDAGADASDAEAASPGPSDTPDAESPEP